MSFWVTDYEYSLGKMIFYAIWWSRNGIGYNGWDTGVGQNRSKDTFLSRNRFVVGNGGWVGFLKDLWVVQKTLRSRFPKLFALSRCRGSNIFRFILWLLIQYHWTLVSGEL